jgi:hypothetical protein
VNEVGNASIHPANRSPNAAVATQDFILRKCNWFDETESSLEGGKREERYKSSYELEIKLES